MFHYSVVFRLFRQYSIRGHKGQNSTGTQCHGFLVFDLSVVVFWSWNRDVVAFCPLKKRLGVTMSWLICLHFWMSWCFSPRISILWFLGLGISMSWFFGLGIQMSLYICLHGLVFVIIVKTKNCKTKIVVEKYFNCPNLCKSICIMYA